MRPLQWIAAGLTLALAAALAWVHYDLLSEAYGGGPPHYSRTTNMDKWSSPVAELLVIDATGIAVVYVLIRFALRRRG